jgi:aminocarboxymuconate-semialdehyde decarboxylase
MPEELPRWADKWGYGNFVHMEHIAGSCPRCANMMQSDKFFRKVEENCWSGSVRLDECDSHGVHVQVLSTIPVLFHYWAKAEHALETSRYMNDHLAGVVAQNPKRFVGLGTVPLQDPQMAIQELERCVNELGFAGVEIGSHVNDWNLNAPELFPFFEAAERLGACIFVHPWDMMGKDKMTDYWLPWLVGMPAESSLAICSMIFGGVFERLPKLRVAFAHGGGSFPATIGRIEHGFQVRPDLVAKHNNVNPRDYLGRFWLDSLVHDPLMLEYVTNLVGPEKVALGTDYPFPLGELAPVKLIREMPWSDDKKAWLLHRSALAFLGLDQNQFL